jgi:hypothetical protein
MKTLDYNGQPVTLHTPLTTLTEDEECGYAANYVKAIGTRQWYAFFTKPNGEMCLDYQVTAKHRLIELEDKAGAGARNTPTPSLLNYRAFEVTYLPCTNHRPSRVKIVDTRGTSHGNAKLPKVIISFDSVYKGSSDQAAKHLTDLGIELVGIVEMPKSTLLLTRDFTTPLKAV